jgi:hypothetical protein
VVIVSARTDGLPGWFKFGALLMHPFQGLMGLFYHNKFPPEKNI